MLVSVPRVIAPFLSLKAFSKKLGKTLTDRPFTFLDEVRQPHHVAHVLPLRFFAR